MSKRRDSGSSAKRSPQRRWPLGLLVFGVAILGGAILGIVLAYQYMQTRTPTVEASQKAIVGKWVNQTGGELDFNADGSGYIPPYLDTQPYNFKYYFQDATHLVMAVAGETMIVEIRLVNNKLTWYTSDPNVKYEYTRKK